MRWTPLVAAALLAACAPGEAPAGPPVVVATLHPVGDLLRALGGDAVRVEVLLPPRASPATWEATPSQLRAVAGAAGFVMVGGGLDAWLAPLGASAELPVLTLTEGLELSRADHAHEGASGDPHVWLDPVLVRDRLVPAMEGFLAGLVPRQAVAVAARAAALRDSLTALDDGLRELLSAAPGRDFVATHDAWTYFARRYGLTSLGSLYERPGHEPSARGLARLVEEARGAGLGAVLAEPQLAGTAAEALAAELGARVEVVDPLGGPGLEGREGYLEMMRFNGRAFARALGARDGPGAP